MPASQVLVAAGPWSPALIDPTGAWRPIRPLWGVVVEIELAEPPRLVLEEAEIDGRIGAESHIGDEAASDFSLITAAGVSAVGLHVPRRRARSRDLDGAAAEPGADVRARASPRRRSVAFARAHDPCPTTAARSSGRCPASKACSSAPATARGASRPGPASARIVTDLMLGRSAWVAPELDAARFGVPSSA